MPISAGTRLGRYEILSQIGAGGMGEVYKGRDTRLNRIVAIKVANERFSDRFEREANAIAALNHPHICQLFDVGPNYLVMEYLEGQEIKGPLPVDQACRLAIQLADALIAAHGKGIVHGDLKPANILLTKGGVKVLDFGLAKIECVGHSAETDDTVKMPTPHDWIAGTPHYMAPELLRGKESDARADLFAFGCVLYELLMGKRAFAGDSIANVIAAILKHPAPSISAVAPANLDRVVMKCLAKDPDERWQTARDLKDELEWIMKGLDDAPQPKIRKNYWILAGAAVVALIGLAAIAGYFSHSSPAEPVIRLSIRPPEGHRFADLNHGAVALSPDGRFIAFVAESAGQRAIWLQSLASLDAHKLIGTEGASQPFWSPNNHMLAFVAQDTLRRIDVSSGVVQKICDLRIQSGGAIGITGGTWSRDDDILLSGATSGPLFRVSALGGQLAPATTLDPAQGEIYHIGPVFLDDGKHFLFHRRAAHAGKTEHEVWAGLLGSTARSHLLDGTTRARYAQSHAGKPACLLYVRGTALMAQHFDATTLELIGNPVTIAEGVSVTPGSTDGNFSVSATGVLAYRRGAFNAANAELEWFDRSGKPAGAIARGASTVYNPWISRDGKSVLAIVGSAAAADVWIFDLLRGVPSRLTFSSRVATAVWSPDGARVAYATADGYVYVRSASGAGSEVMALHSEGSVSTLRDWSPDGRLLLLSRMTASTTRFLAVEPMAGGPARESLLAETPPAPFHSTTARFFPALRGPSRWFAYQSRESGRDEVYVQSMPGETPRKWQVSNDGGVQPVWGRNGRELFYLAPDGMLMAVDIRTAPTFQLAAAHALFRAPRGPAGSTYPTYDVSPDGGKFLFNGSNVTPDDAPIEITVNWQEMLKTK